MRNGALFFAVFIMVLAGEATAQQRTLNTGVGSVNRVWPESGVWITILGKHAGSQKLQCNVLTGIRSTRTGEDYFWGWRDFDGDLAFVINEGDLSLAKGNNINVWIDNVLVFQLHIANRLEIQGHVSMAAPVPGDKVTNTLDLLRSGGTIKLVTDASSYSASLEGSSVAMQNFDECRAQAARLNAVIQ